MDVTPSMTLVRPLVRPPRPSRPPSFCGAVVALTEADAEFCVEVVPPPLHTTAEALPLNDIVKMQTIQVASIHV
ncbi:hypothetical protein SERLADRAFT_460830 [Serpula lacrymans var. lacrymans S7.9]|uniref:Uncharacterized protein n=1 Tax=Serpula lacrymans var. lacrymans (strain S7.9) TaxID=578457 RepID=F8NMN3_SERL9|nr:uncharacterized protein SERLADRAFT_460830 [Serpula lacrymans var. lacrymans S7.9]EGO27430.1 hypothetical protein SERLADRAFT_460830 [Serpula lacrymans var. lacrymans S7.9]